jgi:imidazole glycerol-phosphate synthase subunit HisF
VRRIRVIPTLLIDRDGRLVKTVRFGARTYIGDPINAVRIFNQKQVDELLLLDIDATRDGREPNYGVIEDIVSEAFMPVGYGGGVRSVDQIGTLLRLGLEKVVLSSAAFEMPALVTEAASRFGDQAIVVCLEVKRSLFGSYGVKTRSGSKDTGETPEAAAKGLVARGAGEIIVYSIDRDGTWQGYDVALLARVAAAVGVPVVACGGASGLADLRAAVADAGCSAVAAGSLFVYQGKGRGVLITYPSQQTLAAEVFSGLPN